MSRKLLIAAYGDQEDRDKLAKLSEVLKISQSQILITMLRDKYKEVFGLVNTGTPK